MSGQSSNTQSRKATSGAKEENPYGPGNATSGGNKLAWTMVDALVVTETMDAVNSAGDGISFAKGSRGDWLSVTLLVDGDRPRWVAYDADEMTHILNGIGNAARKRRP